MDATLIYFMGFILAVMLAWLIIQSIRAFRACRLILNGKYRNVAECERAIDYFSRQMERDPQDWETCIRRGEAFAFLGDYQQATRDYTRALSLHPGDESILVRRGRSYYKLRKYDEAIWDCTRALAINPRYIPAYSLRGQAYFESGAYDLAVRDHIRAIEMKKCVTS
ncbi:MAG TPA: tetratricopeptide repeat protein [Ktedonobacteraceae bacterium]|nr:tetratricopeptide repeat protein [Ktedonobacteraceae bacterium]